MGYGFCGGGGWGVVSAFFFGGLGGFGIKMGWWWIEGCFGGGAGGMAGGMWELLTWS